MIALMDPTAGSRRMRQWNGDRLPARVLHDVFPPDQLVQRKRREELRHREPTDRNEQARTYDRELPLQPIGALHLLGRRGNAIAAAARARPWIAARHRGDVDLATGGRLVHAGALQPAEERLPSPTCEGPSSFGLHLPRCLPDEHRLWPRR